MVILCMYLCFIPADGRVNGVDLNRYDSLVCDAGF
jgi:hypothetical protein